MPTRQIAALGLCLSGLAVPAHATPERAPRPACPTLAPAPPSPAAAVPPPLATSSIAVNIPISLATIQPEIDRLIPNLSDPGWMSPHEVADGVCATWFFDRQPISLKMDGLRLRIAIPGGFGMIAGPHTDLFGCTQPYVSCGDKTAGAAPIPVQINLSTALSVDSRYRISVALTNDGTAFLQPCNLMGNIVNATPTIRAIIDGLITPRLATLNSTISSKADFRPRIEAAWSAIQRPQKVASDLWLTIHPTELAGQVSAVDPNTISVQAVARATIELVNQPAAPVVATTPLPDLTPAPPGVAPGIHVGVLGSISYDLLSKQLQAQLVGHQEDFEYPAGARHHIVIRDLRVTGPVKCKSDRSRTRCVGLTVEFEGDGCGVVYLVGRPAVDNDKQELGVEDLELSVETKDVVVHTAAWLAHGALVDHLKQNLRVSLSSAAGEAKARLHQILQSKQVGGWRLSGTADTVSFGATIGSAGLDYSIDLSGTLGVSLSAP